jgi:hypothetical protein
MFVFAYKTNMGIQKYRDMTQMKFVAKMGSMGDEKYHILVPKHLHEVAKSLRGKQVKVVIDDEI